MLLLRATEIARVFSLLTVTLLIIACGNGMKFIDEASQRDKKSTRMPTQSEIDEYGSKGQMSQVNHSDADAVRDSQDEPAQVGDSNSVVDLNEGGNTAGAIRSDDDHMERESGDAVRAEVKDGNSLADPTENLEVSEEPFKSDLCQNSHGMSEKVIKLTRGLVNFDNSTSSQIIHLVVAGNGEFRMDSESLSQVKALCIDSRGNSRVSVNLGGNVDILEYRGVGNGQAMIKVADNEKARMISGSLTGNHKLSFEASAEWCVMADIEVKGNSVVSCNP